MCSWQQGWQCSWMKKRRVDRNIGLPAFCVFGPLRISPSGERNAPGQRTRATGQVNQQQVVIGENSRTGVATPLPAFLILGRGMPVSGPGSAIRCPCPKVGIFDYFFVRACTCWTFLTYCYTEVLITTGLVISFAARPASPPGSNCCYPGPVQRFFRNPSTIQPRGVVCTGCRSALYAPQREEQALLYL
jgi:hypothetical protein